MTALMGQRAGESLRQRYIANRRDVMAASYAMTRYDLLGVVRIVLRKVPATVTRNGYGAIVDCSPGYDIEADVVHKFARFVQRLGMETGTGEFSRETRALNNCNNPLREIIERNLIAFAEGRSFEPWQ